MRGRRTPLGRAHRRNAAKVATVATLLVCLAAVAFALATNYLVARRLNFQANQEVSTRLVEALRSPPFGRETDTTAPVDAHLGVGIYGAALLVWQVAPDGHVLHATSQAPSLPSRAWPGSTGTQRVSLAGTPYLLASSRFQTGWMITGESLAELTHIQSVLTTSELVALPLLVVVVLLGSFAIAMRSVEPVERERRRQLELTADASHELRTPLTVIDAEVALARSHPGTSEDTDLTLGRIATESARMKRAIEDLLWLARFDAEPAPPRSEPIDLATIAVENAERFSRVGEARRIRVRAVVEPAVRIHLDAPAEWVDRLTGVLLDNACRYARDGGEVVVRAVSSGARVSLAVEDDGPGIPPLAREHLFDRFRRATDTPGGYGLGLAIADSIVRSTAGRWEVGSSSTGGARLEVSWPRA